MNDLVDMKIFQGTDDLYKIILDFHLSESFSSLDEFIESMIGTNFQKNVHVFMIFEYMFELDDMIVIEGFVDFNFSNKLSY